MTTDSQNLCDKATIDGIYNYGVTIFEKLQSLSEQNYRTAVEQKAKAEQLDKSLTQKAAELEELQRQSKANIDALASAKDRDIQEAKAMLKQEQSKVQDLQTQINDWKYSSQLIEHESENLKKALTNIYTSIRANSQKYCQTN